MNWESGRALLAVAGELARVGLRDLARNRWLVAVSLVAGVVLWALIQDVENPRLEAVVPADNYQPIPVEPVNLPDGLVLQEALFVRLRVKASEADLPVLTAEDFTATIDLRDLKAGETVARPVQVTSKRSDVRVVAVQPPSFLVTPEAAAVRELPVTVRITGDLPAGFRLAEGSVPSVDSPIATVTGRADLVDTVATVEIELNVTGVRDETYTSEGELVARTAGGNRVDLVVTPARTRATVQVEQVVAQRTVPVNPTIEGDPADGYRITSITVDPAVVTVTGPTAVIEGLTKVSAERVDISGAKNQVTRTKKIVALRNLSTDVSTVVIRVQIEPYECGVGVSSPCGGQTVVVAPIFGKPPSGLALRDTAYSVSVMLVGPLDKLALLGPEDIEVSVSLAGTSPGLNVLQPSAEIVSAGLNDVSITTVNTLTVTMVTVATPSPSPSPTPSPTP